MSELSVPTPPCEDYIDVATLRILDLRTFGQDEIRSLTHLCGDGSVRLQDFVNVIVDKSIFNESLGSRKQTYDRDRIPLNRQRPLAVGSAAIQLHLAGEDKDLTHKELILHLCRQLKIENGDRALYQPQESQQLALAAGGSPPVRLARIGRASTAMATSMEIVADNKSLGNGNEPALASLYRSGKKLKTKEEARRRAAEALAAVASEAHGDEFERRAIRFVRQGEQALGKDIPADSMDSAPQIEKNLLSPETGAAGTSAPLETPTSLNPCKQIKAACRTCGRSFFNIYSLKRHTVSTGHASDPAPRIGTPLEKRKSQMMLPKETDYVGKHHLSDEKSEDKGYNQGTKLGKRKLDVILPEHPPKRTIRHYTCRICRRQFIRRKQYFRHVKTHFTKGEKKMSKRGKKIGRAHIPSRRMKIRLGKSSVVNQTVHMTKGATKQKRKLEVLLSGRQLQSQKADEGSQQTSNQSNLVLICQECGKIFDNFSRYTGHLSMHTKIRKVLVTEGNIPGTASIKKNVINKEDLPSLGFRKLLSATSGTYLSGLPAKFLFSDSGMANQKAGNV
ncbi:hypothetical protein KP509_20G018800 [Ceratopteris richardii]|uniref:C2H2-type domain-containing protein n=1 Tax=Ceratopteris richardii TaxID=49495 RepID=A0A8T2SF91_CERRI|nr:hypothetical protein KP509_20G018800 [Ceratopteris richardii]